jgi:hypothetical protein
MGNNNDGDSVTSDGATGYNNDNNGDWQQQS